MQMKSPEERQVLKQHASPPSGAKGLYLGRADGLLSIWSPGLALVGFSAGRGGGRRLRLTERDMGSAKVPGS